MDSPFAPLGKLEPLEIQFVNDRVWSSFEAIEGWGF